MFWKSFDYIFWSQTKSSLPTAIETAGFKKYVVTCSDKTKIQCIQFHVKWGINYALRVKRIDVKPSPSPYPHSFQTTNNVLVFFRCLG